MLERILENNFHEQIPVNETLAGFMKIVNEFSIAYYHTPVVNDKPIWQNTYWSGIKTLKCPLDLWLYQEIIFSQKPDFIVECGVAFGGTTAFLADMCQLAGKGKVIGVDIEILDKTRADLRRCENIQLIQGDSTSIETAQQIFQIVENKNILVILDSDHHQDHVLKELMIYEKLIPTGGYLVIEDTNINGHPVYPDYGPGPMEAVIEFLDKNSDFYVDNNCHKFMMSFNPNGFLRRR
jgi:cephalosporin hydroxylase